MSMDFHQTWCVHWYCADLGWDCRSANFINFWQSSAQGTSTFLDDNFSKCCWIFTKLCMCIDIVDWRSALGLQMSKFCLFWQSYLPAIHPYFTFRTITWVNLNGFSPNLICAFILWRSALGLLIGKFGQFWQLSARDMIMAGFFTRKKDLTFHANCLL